MLYRRQIYVMSRVMGRPSGRAMPFVKELSSYGTVGHACVVLLWADGLAGDL